MSDVFVSYARSSEEQARQVEDALRNAGYGVWRDAELPAHRSYAEVIEERLKAAKAVVVLWSEEAAKSHWVRAEADSARESGTLAQASVDGTIPPMPFNQIQCAALKGWAGESDHAGWQKLLASVADLLEETRELVRPAKAQAPVKTTSICVLPFANMSGDPEQEYFSDGISEDITTDLSKVSALEVTARNTAFTFKGRSVDVCDVARKLGVTHVLEGSVRKAGNRLRITAQLINGETGGHVWADRYDRDLDDIFAIQDEISQSIVAALKVKLLPEEKKAIEQRGTTNVEAYKLYLLARQYWATGNHGDPRREERVMRICSRAVQIDPYYAQAWALLAIAQSNLRYGFSRQVDDGFVAAHTALSIDPTVAEAHCAIVRRLEEQGKHDEAEAEIRKALEIAPDSWEVNKEASYFARIRGDVPNARKYLEKAVEVMDSDFQAWATLATYHQAQGETEKVREAAAKMVSEAEKAIEQDPSNGAALGVVAGGYAILGEADRAREWIERAMLIDPDNLNMRYNFACVLATYVDDKEEALRLLDPTLALAGKKMLKVVVTDPDFDCLRDDPRFKKMIARERKRHGMKETAAVEIATPSAAS
ncbi:MAG TPA: TIR domain-containing protein [Sphingomicrobium sp.]|jgi:adenylate cyclase|nr:TIR domain-containing protein [Sphingomicrobium sp.]